MAMLFEKDMDPRCIYCKRGQALDGQTVICCKRGVLGSGGGCHRFRYDPLKRVPPKPLPVDFSQWKQEDFSL